MTHEALIQQAYEALRQNPADAQTLANLGQHFFAQGNWPLAAAYLEAAACLGNAAQLDLMRGQAAIRRGEYLHARYCFDRVLALEPDHLEAQAGRGNSFYLNKEWEQARVIYERIAQRIAPQADIHTHLGHCYRRLLRFDEAAAAYQRALELQPTPDVLCERARVVFESGKVEEAHTLYRKAMEYYPNNPNVRYNYGFFLMHIGQWNEGLPLYEERWNTSGLGPRYHRIIDHLTQPMWDGKASLEGKTVMAMIEQGGGDLIQFARYTKPLRERGAEVDILAPPFMETIMQTVPWVRAVHTRYEDIPSYDYYVPLMSCPLFFGLTPSTIPGMTAPYITAKAPRARFSEKPTVGLVWAGDPNNEYECYRAPGFSAYLPLIETHPDVCFVALQVGAQAAQAAQAIAEGKLLDGASAIRDYGDTANLFASIDLLISSCTSPLHLAGAMGIPACGLLSASPDWRWFGQTKKTPWYPSMVLYRQERIGEWSGVIEAVSKSLPRHLFHARAK